VLGHYWVKKFVFLQEKSEIVETMHKGRERRTEMNHRIQEAHQAAAYPGFFTMKSQGVFLLQPGWDASPL